MKPGDLGRGNAAIDEAAESASAATRARSGACSTSASSRPIPREFAERLAALAIEDGIGTFILAGDDPRLLQTFGEEVAPAVREIVAGERAERGTAAASVRSVAAIAARRDGHRLRRCARGTPAIEPGDFGYADVRSTYMRGGRPGIVLQPDSPAQVAEAIAFARRHPDVALAVRSGGHGISGRSTNDGGIVIDLRRLNDDRGARRGAPARAHRPRRPLDGGRRGARRARLGAHARATTAASASAVSRRRAASASSRASTA